MENHIFSLQTSWRDGLSKKLRWNMIFLALSGKMIFVFPENMMLPLRGKMKDDVSQKKTKKNPHRTMIFSSNVLKRWSFQKGSRREMIFPVLPGKMVFFYRKHDIFWEVTFLKKYMGIWYFLCTPAGVRIVAPRPPSQKKSKMVLSCKNTLKGDRRSRFTF